MQDKVTTGDILEAVNKGFQGLQDQMSGVNNRLIGVEDRLTKVENRLESVERKLDRTDGKVNALVNILEKKQVITEDDKRVVHA